MSTIERIRSAIIDAMKRRDPVDTAAYRYLKGEIDQLPGNPPSDAAIVSRLRAVLKDATKNPQSFSKREVNILQGLLPQSLDASQTRELLQGSDVVDSVLTTSTDGMAMGIAMKFFAGRQVAVDGNVVRQVVAEMRAAAVTG